jgi:hypothetical protein
VRASLFVVLVACGSAQEKSQQPIALPGSPSVSASASTAAGRRDDGPVGQVQDVILHWLDLLARGEDERFIDEAVLPEELDKVLGSRTKAELVVSFKEDKHAEVVKVLTLARRAKPDDVREDGKRTYVKFEGDGVRHITFVVEGAHVWIHN